MQVLGHIGQSINKCGKSRLGWVGILTKETDKKELERVRMGSGGAVMDKPYLLKLSEAKSY